MKNIENKAKQIGIEILELQRQLPDCGGISSLLIKNGTGIGRDIHFAIEMQNEDDRQEFIETALDKTIETEYWLDFLFEAKYMDNKIYQNLIRQCMDIKDLLIRYIE